MVLIVAQSVGVPAEGMGLILGVDRFLDMCRTTVNVSGDLVIAALVAGPSPRSTTATSRHGSRFKGSGGSGFSSGFKVRFKVQSSVRTEP